MTAKKIVLVTSGQPSLNPRLVKEADALADAGYEVTVLYAYWNDWGTAFDELLLPSKKWQAIRIGGHPQQQPVVYFFTKLIYKMAKLALNLFGTKYFASYAIARSSFFLSRAAKKHTADLYIGHNLGALPAVINAGSYNNKPCGFDAEDFHRNEVSNDPANTDVILKTYLEDKYIPQTDYLTVSSPLAGKAYQKLFPAKKPVTILNVFNKNLDIKINSRQPDLPLKLFWFSQTIGTNRGIEDILKALHVIKGRKFELHLMGKLRYNIPKEYFETMAGHMPHRLHFHDPVAPNELIAFASQFDIGLALEPAFSINNDVSLPNKIFTYLQAGLTIIASNTTAQHAFMKKYPGIGRLYEIGNIHALSDILLHYSENTDELNRARQASLSLAQTSLNWETEQQKFLKIIQQTLVS